MKVVVALLLIAYPLLVHAAVLLHEPRLAALALVMLITASLIRPLSVPRAWAWFALAAAAAALYALSRTAGGFYAAYLPSLVIPAVLAGVFGSSLRAGRQPLIEGFARRARGGELPDVLVRYTRRLTAAWTLLFVLMFASALLLIALGRREAWSLLTNIVNYVVIGAFVVGEFAWRRWRYAQYMHGGLIAHIRNVAASRPGSAR